MSLNAGASLRGNHEIRLGQPCDFKMWDGLRRVSSTVKPDVGFYILTGWKNSTGNFQSVL